MSPPIALLLDGVCFQYPGAARGFQNLRIAIRRGEIFGIMGKSGAGKTTLLRIIGGHHLPSRGSIHVDGVDVSTIPTEHRGTATVFQSYALFPHLSVSQNISFGLDHGGTRPLTANHRDVVQSLLDELGLTPLANRSPAELSGGEMQRAAIARALAIHPKILLMDEPFAALDAGARLAAKRLIRSIQSRHGTTILMVSHDQDELFSLCNTVAVLENFSFLQIGTPDQLMLQPDSESVAGYLAGFERIDFIPNVHPFHCHLAHIRLDQSPTNGDLPCVSARIKKVSRRLDAVEVELTTDSPNAGRTFTAFTSAHASLPRIGDRVFAVFTQVLRFQQ